MLRKRIVDDDGREGARCGELAQVLSVVLETPRACCIAASVIPAARWRRT